MMNRFIKITLVLILCLFFTSCEAPFVEDKKITEPIAELNVVFLDVDQGDCEIIQFPDGRNVLIDAGTNEWEHILVYQIQELGIKKFDYVIATHPHEDHIGGMDSAICNFEVGCIYMPDSFSNTNAFQDLIDSIQSRNVKVIEAKAGVNIIDEENIDLTFVAPNSEDYEDKNNYSAAVKLTYGNCSFLFMGDAEGLSEMEILENGMDIKSDVLKVGHHGSTSSTTKKFLNAVNPRYAVIEVGIGNSYGHPHRKTLEKLKNVTVYRTDLNGTITAKCDGININFTTER